MKQVQNVEALIRSKMLQLKFLIQKIENCNKKGYTTLSEAYTLELETIKYEIFHPESIRI